MHNRSDAEIERESRFIEEDRLDSMRPEYLPWLKDDEVRTPMGVPASVLELNPDIGKEAA